MRPLRVLAGTGRFSKGPIYAVALTKDGKYCLTGGEDKTLRLYNPWKADPVSEGINTKTKSKGGGDGFSSLEEALLVKCYSGPHGYEVKDIAISGDNSRFSSCGGDKVAFVWDVSSGAVIRRLQGHQQSINAVAANEEFTLLATGSYDRSIKCWDLRSQNRSAIQELQGCTDSVSSVVVEQGNSIVAGCIDGVVRTFDLRVGQLIEDRLHVPVTSTAISEDQNCILANCLASEGQPAQLILLQRNSGKKLVALDGHVNAHYSLRGCLFKGDSVAVSGSEDGCIYMWDILSGTLLRILKGHTKAASQVVSHHEEAMMVSASYDGMVVVWQDD